MGMWLHFFLFPVCNRNEVKGGAGEWAKGTHVQHSGNIAPSCPAKMIIWGVNLGIKTNRGKLFIIISSASPLPAGMCVRIRASNHFQQQKQQQQVYPDDRDVRVLYGTVPRPRSRWMGEGRTCTKAYLQPTYQNGPFSYFVIVRLRCPQP